MSDVGSELSSRGASVFISESTVFWTSGQFPDWLILQLCERSRVRPRKQNARQYLLARMRSPVGREHLLHKHVVVLTKIY